MPLTACTIQPVLSTDNPNEGRVKINNNFDCLDNTISSFQLTNSTGFTSISDGSNITTTVSFSGLIPDYTVNVVSTPSFNSVESTSVSANTYFVGSVDLLTLLSATSIFTTGLTGTYSIKALNDSTTDALGDYAVAEGKDTIASGISSHSEGSNTTAIGDYSHSQGYYTTAIGSYSDANGYSSISIGNGSHAEGSSTTSIGSGSHSEGIYTTSEGTASHAGGQFSVATGITSFIHSTNSFAFGDRSVVLGGENLTGSSNDTVYVPFLNVKNIFSGTSTASLGIDSGGNVVTAATLNIGRVLFVSPTGNDSTGEVGNLNRPWRNLYSAKSASTSGDTVYVLPGTWIYDNRNSAGNPYNGQVDTLVNLWKNGVTYYFAPGTKVVMYNQTVSGSNMYLFRPSGVTYETCTVLGHLEYEQNSTGVDTSNGANYYFNGATISTDTGYTFFSQTKLLKSNHCEVINYSRAGTGTSVTRITINTDQEEYAYLGGQSSTGGFYRVSHTGVDYLEFKAYATFRRYTGGYYPFYLSTNSNGSVNIYGEEIYSTGNNIFLLRSHSGFNTCSVKRIYYNTAYTPFGMFGAVVSTLISGGWTMNLDADLIDVSANGNTTGVFYLQTAGNTLNHRGNITTNTASGVGRFIIATTTTNTVNITGDITLIGTATTTNVLFQPNGGATINYTGKITGNYGGPLVKTYNGVANINNSFIQTTVDNSSAQVFQNGATSSGTCRINSSYIEMRNNTGSLANGSYVKALINNSTIINSGTGTTLSNTTNFGTLQLINSTIMTSGGTSISYASAGTPVISSNSVSNANYNAATIYGTIGVINELTY